MLFDDNPPLVLILYQIIQLILYILHFFDFSIQVVNDFATMLQLSS